MPIYEFTCLNEECENNKTPFEVLCSTPVNGKAKDCLSTCPKCGSYAKMIMSPSGLIKIK